MVGPHGLGGFGVGASIAVLEPVDKVRGGVGGEFGDFVRAEGSVKEVHEGHRPRKATQ